MSENELSEVNKRVAGLKNTEDLQFRSSDQIISMLILAELEKLNVAIIELKKGGKKHEN